jgi:hypothetical protein
VIEDTRAAGMYLGHLTRSFDLQPPGAWSIHLTERQYDTLATLLAGQLRAGESVVVLNELEARRSGGRIKLRIGGSDVVLPAEIAPLRWLADPAPIACFLGAVWKLQTKFNPMDMTPFRVIALPVAIDVLIGLSYRSANPSDDQLIVPVAAAFASGALLLASTLLTTDGPTYAFGHPCVGTGALLAGIYWDRLSVRQRQAVAVAGVALTIGYIALNPVPVAIGLVLQESVGPLVFAATAKGIGGRFDAETAEYSRRLQARTDELTAAAYDEGIAEECSSLLRMVERGTLALNAIADSLPAIERSELQQRFLEAKRWVQYRSESLSLMTNRAF